MIALLTLFSLAAFVCPPQVQVSPMIGGQLYERVFHHHIEPLVYLAAVCTLVHLR